jgi:hypothetical protein
MLFKDDTELVDVMMQVVKWAGNRDSNAVLLPNKFRQDIASKQYCDLIVGVK